MTFSLEKAILWIEDSYFNQKQWFKVKNVLMMELFITNMQLLEMLLVDYCDDLDSHSDGTHSLQRIHWWASDVMLHFSKSVPINEPIHLHLGWPEGVFISENLNFGWTIPLNHLSCKKITIQISLLLPFEAQQVFILDPCVYSCMQMHTLPCCQEWSFTFIRF